MPKKIIFGLMIVLLLSGCVPYNTLSDTHVSKCKNKCIEYGLSLGDTLYSINSKEIYCHCEKIVVLQTTKHDKRFRK